ncbi:hypothetical protein DRJ22_04565 [Candidatus Woesearchaeota archaeon]|nr:MAG: hypothetical protein B6U93_01985 [Candidatus Woesearchaeota archaeon ex4484_78]RLE45351.1 MAG: hypothetical protein DRJ22_04565 [Candidatus Woesearchaeota archaeon]
MNNRFHSLTPTKPPNSTKKKTTRKEKSNSLKNFCLSAFYFLKLLNSLILLSITSLILDFLSFSISKSNFS